ncbi:MAG: diguanylate cyclase [Rhodocyclaceae bacterium]|nr:diguanylate cyclase [Rhodocyclaceae bacterium]
MKTFAIGFRGRLLLGAVLPALMISSLLITVFLERYQVDLERLFQERGETIARQIGPAAEYALFSGSHETLRMLAEGMRQGDTSILSVSVLDRAGRTLARSGPAPRQAVPLTDTPQVQSSEQLTTMAEPIRQTALPLAGGDGAWEAGAPLSNPAVVGYVVVEISRAELAARQREMVEIALMILMGGFLLATWVSIRIAAGVTRPIARINEVVARIGRGDLEARVAYDPAGVLAPLETGINGMAEKIAAAQHDLQDKIAAATAELRQQKEAAEALARVDMLTGLANRRAFDEAALHEIQRAIRYGTPLALIMADLDFFKAINDKYGHHVGDQVLVDFARMLSASVRGVDLAGRWGGEEFIILMPGATLDEAVQAAERMRLAVAAAPTKIDGASCGYTASFGVAGFSAQEPTLDALLGRADRALYRAKALGRNRVEVD